VRCTTIWRTTGLAMTVIDCPHGVARERMPKADARGLAPKKSADHNPPVHDSFVREGLAYSLSQIKPISLVRFSERRWDTARAYTPTQASILSHSRVPSTPQAGHIGKESENAAGEKADTWTADTN
jgi:hypothetical protein